MPENDGSASRDARGGMTACNCPGAVVLQARFPGIRTDIDPRKDLLHRAFSYFACASDKIGYRFIIDTLNILKSIFFFFHRITLFMHLIIVFE